MPQLNSVSSLRTLCSQWIIDCLHEQFKTFTSKKNKRNSSQRAAQILRLRYQTVDWLKVIPTSIQSDLFDLIHSKLRDNSLLDEEYFTCLNAFWNENTRVMNMSDARIFQDSSMALEKFLQNIKSAPRIRELVLTQCVIDLICFDFVPVFQAISSLKYLDKLVLQGLDEVEVESTDIHTFLLSLQRNCGDLKFLDLSGLSLDEDCCQILCRMMTLRILRLNKCSVSTEMATELLQSLTNLVQFDCDNQLQIIAASLQDQNLEFENPLQNITFRDLNNLDNVGKIWPSLKNVRIIYREYESEYFIGDGLDKLLDYKEAQKLALDLHIIGANLLLQIQIKGYSQFGSFITNLTMNQCEFLHPQSLNKWSRFCPNLKCLSLLSCNSVDDNMFVGDLPDLEDKGFKNLQESRMEGDISLSIARYILSGRLRKVTLNCKQGFFQSEFLECLLQGSKFHLETLHLVVEKCGVEFSETLLKLIEESGNLNSLQILCSRQSDISFELEQIQDLIKRRNWNLNFVYYVKQRSSQY